MIGIWRDDIDLQIVHQRLRSHAVLLYPLPDIQYGTFQPGLRAPPDFRDLKMLPFQAAHQPGRLFRCSGYGGSGVGNGGGNTAQRDLDVDILSLRNIDAQHAACSGERRRSLFFLCGRSRLCFRQLLNALQHLPGQSSEGIAGLGKSGPQHLPDGQASRQIQQIGIHQIVKNGGILQVVGLDNGARFRTAAKHRRLLLMLPGIFG